MADNRYWIIFIGMFLACFSFISEAAPVLQDAKQVVMLSNKTKQTRIVCAGSEGTEVIAMPGESNVELIISSTQATWTCGPRLDKEARYEAYTLSCKHVNPVKTVCIASMVGPAAPKKKAVKSTQKTIKIKP